MSDKITTLRSDYYKRPFPFVRADGSLDEEALRQRVQDTYKKIGVKPDPSTGTYLPSRDERRKALVASNQWLAPLLDMVAEARLNQLNSDEAWAKDKNYGWGHRIDFKEKPQDNEYFRIYQDPVTGEVYVEDTDKAIELMDEDSADPKLQLPADPKTGEKPMGRYESGRKVFEDFVNEPYKQYFVPMTRAEADSAKMDWYPTTQEFLNALVETQLGHGNKEALFDAAQMALSEMSQKDLKSDNPKYDKARARMMNDNGTSRAVFVAPSAIKTGLLNMAIPFTNAVMNDPELWDKTSSGEAKGRVATDVGLNLATALLPWGLGARGAMMTSRPLLGAMAGGAIGGNLNYWLGRLANQAWDAGSGHGGIEQPIDLADMTGSTLLGMVDAAGMNTNRISGMKDLQTKMWRGNPNGVKGKHITQSIDLMKNDGDFANGKFVSKSFDKYESKYPNGARKVQLPPQLRAYVDDVTGSLKLDTNLPMGRRSGDLGKRGTPDANKVMRPIPGDIDPATKKPRLVPHRWARGDDPQFINQYVKDNADYFNGVLTKPEEIESLGHAARLAQIKDHPMAQLFTGGTDVIPDTEFKKLLSSLRGNNLAKNEHKRANAAMSKVIANKQEVGNLDKTGKFVKGDKKQQKLFNKAMDDYSNRSQMKMVTEADKQEAFKHGLGGKVSKVATPIVMTAATNAVPWGSNVVLGVRPYTYEAFPDEE